MSAVIVWQRLRLGRWRHRLGDAATSLAAFGGVPVLIWFNAPALSWLMLWGITRWVPNWIAWWVAFLFSAQLSVLLGWNWGGSFILAALTVALRHWPSIRSSWIRWTAELLCGGVWIVLAVLHGSQSISSGMFVFLCGAAFLWLTRDQEQG